jgi:multiple sugar transport system permease protein
MMQQEGYRTMGLVTQEPRSQNDAMLRQSPEAHPSVRSRRRKSRGTLSKPPAVGFLLTTPAVLLVVLLVICPLLYAIYISLTDFPLIGPYHFVGFTNYKDLPSDPGYVGSLLLTLTYTAIVTGPILVIGYGLAMLTRSNRRGAAIFRACFFLPFIVGLTVESFILDIELTPSTGAVNYILREVGITNGATAWTVNTTLAMLAISLLVIWFGSGFTMVLLLAGMQAVPRELLESADIDGATWYGKETRIYVPLVRRSIALSLVLSVVGSFLAFNQFEIITGGGPGTSTDPIVLYIYQVGFSEGLLGRATAMALVLVLIVGLITAAQLRLLRSKEELA